ncbi:hypothetical protein HD554DRAFT_2169469 [Boletus coccyginus]|nr:hypothetical protein HD554DRAFT_2169469 [Boletus coccyginus]
MDNPDPECPQMGSNLTSQSQMPSAIVISQSNGDCMNQDPPPDINLTPQSQIPLAIIISQTNNDCMNQDPLPDINLALQSQMPLATVTSQRSIDHRDLNPPLSPPTSAPLGDPIRSARPLLLPRTYQTVIDQAIAEHLEAATMGLVEPTVRGIIDACVPHLTEFIESRFVTLTPSRLNPPCKAHQCCSAPREEDYDGNNDHDTGEDAVSSTLIPSGPKAELPASALVDAVRTFNQDGISPPLLENVMWNSEAISILSLDFYNNLKGGTYRDVIFDEQTMNLQAICKLCEQKLVMAQIAAKKENRRKGDRMIAHRHGTLARCKKIASQNRSRDPDKWDAVHKIIDGLGVEAKGPAAFGASLD